MTRHSYLNPFVVFPTKELEEEWRYAPPRSRSSAELADDFELLLERAVSEQQVHDFLEEHPQLLPGLGHYHNGPRGDLVVTKLPLGNDFVSDFAFVSENSQMVHFTCIEIEAPAAKLFAHGATLSRAYLNARQQIADWNVWAQQNMKEAVCLFGRLGQWLPQRYYEISLSCILIMGRRAEINTVKRKQRWAAEGALMHASMSVMTYDRLLDRMKSGYVEWKDKMLVCRYRDRCLEVKRISA